MLSSLLFIEVKQEYFGRYDRSSHFLSKSKIKKSKFVLLIETLFLVLNHQDVSKCENNKITARVKVSIFTKNLHYFRRKYAKNLPKNFFRHFERKLF